MAATASDLTLIRLAIGDTSSVTFTDAELQVLWTAAAEDYNATTETRLIQLQVVVDAIESIMADAAKRVSYRANSSSENLSDVFTHLKALHEKHTAKLEAAKATSKGAVRIGTLKKVPSRLKEWPDD